jgi:Putative peptidoglycan binding domain
MNKKSLIIYLLAGTLVASGAIAGSPPHSGGIAATQAGSVNRAPVTSGTGHWTGGNWNHGNWNGSHGDWHHHHFDGDRFFFAGSFGFPFWGLGYPGWGYGYGYPYYPGSYYGAGYYTPGYYPGYSGYYSGGSYGYSNRRSQVAQIQRRLRAAGYYRGSIDGVMGPRTRSALRAYQRDRGMADNDSAGRRVPQYY